ncbi:MAG: cupin domain-containing protein [Candidatus Methanofastidiosia archaeon]
MYIKDLLSKREVPSEEPVKKDIIKSKNFNIVLVSLEKGQEIDPHPEPYAVFFLVLKGVGLFTNKEGKFELKKNDSLFIEANEIRGIKCFEDLIIMGVQDGH